MEWWVNLERYSPRSTKGSAPNPEPLAVWRYPDAARAQHRDAVNSLDIAASCQSVQQLRVLCSPSPNTA